MENHDDYILEVSDLIVKFQSRTILENVTFKVKRGTTLAVIGPNGAGKTMLFKALLNLVPYSGEIKWAEGVRTLGNQALTEKVMLPFPVRRLSGHNRSSDSLLPIAVVGQHWKRGD